MGDNGVRLKVWLVLGLMAAALPLQAEPVPGARASRDPYVTRGAITRQGRAWVQFLTCHVPAREGGRLTLRADSGSVVVRPDSAAQVGCIVRLAVYGTDEAMARAILGRYELSARSLGGTGVYIGGRFPYER